MDASWLRAFDGLGNRKGMALLVLLTRLVAIGPLILFVADRALFVQLDLARLILLSIACVLPGMFLGSMFMLATETWEADRDQIALRAMLLPMILLNGGDLLTLAPVFLLGKPAVWIVYTEGLMLIAILVQGLGERWAVARARRAAPPADGVE